MFYGTGISTFFSEIIVAKTISNVFLKSGIITVFSLKSNKAPPSSKGKILFNGRSKWIFKRHKKIFLFNTINICTLASTNNPIETLR